MLSSAVVTLSVVFSSAVVTFSVVFSSTVVIASVVILPVIASVVLCCCVVLSISVVTAVLGSTLSPDGVVPSGSIPPTNTPLEYTQIYGVSTSFPFPNIWVSSKTGSP